MELGQRISHWLHQWLTTNPAGAPQRSEIPSMGPDQQRGGVSTLTPPADLLLMRLSYGHGARSLRYSVKHLSRLRAHYQTMRRLIVPIDLPFFHSLSRVVQAVFSGAIVRQARALGYEVEFVCWQGKGGNAGEFVMMRAMQGDGVLLLRGTGMQRHVDCVLSVAKDKNLMVLTDNTKPVWQQCQKC